MTRFYVSIPKRVSEALNLKSVKSNSLDAFTFQSLKGFQRL